MANVSAVAFDIQIAECTMNLRLAQMTTLEMIEFSDLILIQKFRVERRESGVPTTEIMRPLRGKRVVVLLESHQADFIRRGKLSIGNLAVEKFEEEHYIAELLRIDGGTRQADVDGGVFGRENVASSSLAHLIQSGGKVSQPRSS
jgi:hypothetical protein